MARSGEVNYVIMSTAEWATNDVVVPYGVLAINETTGEMRWGNSSAMFSALLPFGRPMNAMMQSMWAATPGANMAGLMKLDTAGAWAPAVGGTDHEQPMVCTLVTPATGATQTFNTLGRNELIHLDHSATIAAQTLVMPTNATSRIGQTLRVYARSIVTAVTLNANGNTIRGAALTTLAVNGSACWMKTAASTWARVQ